MNNVKDGDLMRWVLVKSCARADAMYSTFTVYIAKIGSSDVNKSLEKIKIE